MIDGLRDLILDFKEGKFIELNDFELLLKQGVLSEIDNELKILDREGKLFQTQESDLINERLQK